MKLGIDFKAIATKVGGHAAGAFAFTQLNKAKFMRAYDAPEKQAIKGAIVAGLGYVVAPMLAKKLGFSKGSKGAMVESVGEGLGIVGVMLMGNAVIKPQAGKPALFPVISGVDGTEDYENELAGIGKYAEMAGYEQDPTVAGYEADPTLAGFDDEAV